MSLVRLELLPAYTWQEPTQHVFVNPEFVTCLSAMETTNGMAATAITVTGRERPLLIWGPLDEVAELLAA